MKKRLVWLVVSGFTILSLVLAACAPAVTEEKKKEEVVTKEEVKKEVTVEEKITPGALVPKYGGTLTIALKQWIVNFDESIGGAKSATYGPLHLMNDELFEGDWKTGLAGTGETSFAYPLVREPYAGANKWFGVIAEGYEVPDDSTQVFHIRKGIHFQQEGPAKGRELDANDVAFSFERLIKSPTSFHGLAYPPPMGMISATATDKWTVVVKTYPGKAGYNLSIMGDMSSVIAPEAVQKYGNLAQWEAAAGAGSGPFIITDYIAGNSISLKRNPNYWQKDPFRPENQLPYIDKVNMMIIYDNATRLAALRTGKLDQLGGYGYPLNLDDFESLVKTNPELKWRKDVSGGKGIAMRVDKPELPWYDLRVRTALFKAVDFWAILKDYYKSDAELLSELVANIPEYKDLYIPLGEYPESVQDLYRYDPKKAKELLAEAGYPNGFKAEVVLEMAYVDELSIIAAYWAKIGVNLELQVKEVGALSAISTTRSYSQMIQSTTTLFNPHNQHKWRSPDNMSVSSFVNDPQIIANYDRTTTYYMFNYAEFVKAVRAQLVRGQQLHPYLFLPAPNSYNMWWPWVENYHGEYSVGYYSGPNFIKYIWVNPELKKETLAKR